MLIAGDLQLRRAPDHLRGELGTRHAVVRLERGSLFAVCRAVLERRRDYRVPYAECSLEAKVGEPVLNDEQGRQRVQNEGVSAPDAARDGHAGRIHLGVRARQAWAEIV